MTGWIDELLANQEAEQFAPQRPWSAAQQENHVLFLHYRVPADALRAIVPAPLELQMYDNSAWVAVLALKVNGVHVRRVPMPGPIGNFAEIDFAALVSHEGRLGFFFISIEGAHRVTSFTTRTTTGLPYLYSGARFQPDGDGFHVTSGPRWTRGRAAATFDARYAPSRTGVIPDPGSPIRMLTSQYTAYVCRRGKVYEMDEVHPRWDLTEADLELRCNTIPDAAGLQIGPTPALVHYSPGRSIISWLPVPVRPNRLGLAPPEAPGAQPLP